MAILRLDEALAHHGDSRQEVSEMLTSESLPSSAVRGHVTHDSSLVLVLCRRHSTFFSLRDTSTFQHTRAHGFNACVPYSIGTL